ncbi:dihydropteroate synthase [Fretibacter rubidus]|uniref:dihydropteroate synthase n=1 Tax=Fretibacter rubidus TaxID=570162 RepID=UPI00352A3EF9
MTTRPKIMGILNVTPDSFSDGGQYDSLELAVKGAMSLIEQGADIIDIGGESTRPGAEQISDEVEIERTVPVIAAIRRATQDHVDPPVISIDTRKPSVAIAAVHVGADIWNDVSGLTFTKVSAKIAADLGCPVIVMHAQGSPETMQHYPRYDDPVADVKDYLAKRIDALEFAGIDRDLITIDPGIGFGKTLEHNLAIMKNLKDFKTLGCDVLLGASRKSFIGGIDGSTADRRLAGSLAAAIWGMQAGADILRVHDVMETMQAVRVWGAIDGG